MIRGRLIEPVFTYYFLGLSNEERNEVFTLCLSSSIVQSSHLAILLKLSHFRLIFSAEQLISLFIVVDGAQHLPNVLQRLFQFPSLAHFQRAFSSRLSPHPGSDDTLLARACGRYSCCRLLNVEEYLFSCRMLVRSKSKLNSEMELYETN